MERTERIKYGTNNCSIKSNNESLNSLIYTAFNWEKNNKRINGYAAAYKER